MKKRAQDDRKKIKYDDKVFFTHEKRRDKIKKKQHTTNSNAEKKTFSDVCVIKNMKVNMFTRTRVKRRESVWLKKSKNAE